MYLNPLTTDNDKRYRLHQQRPFLCVLHKLGGVETRRLRNNATTFSVMVALCPIATYHVLDRPTVDVVPLLHVTSSRHLDTIDTAAIARSWIIIVDPLIFQDELDE